MFVFVNIKFNIIEFIGNKIKDRFIFCYMAGTCGLTLAWQCDVLDYPEKPSAKVLISLKSAAVRRFLGRLIAVPFTIRGVWYNSILIRL
jgi:hypothetical protein